MNNNPSLGRDQSLDTMLRGQTLTLTPMAGFYNNYDFLFHRFYWVRNRANADIDQSIFDTLHPS